MTQIQAHPALADWTAQNRTEQNRTEQSKLVNNQYAQSASNGVDGAKKSGDVQSDPLAQKEVFLQLLVAQIKNQNPLDPTDSVQFLTQLSQFSSVEQLVGIRQDIAAMLEHETSKSPGAIDANP